MTLRGARNSRRARRGRKRRLRRIAITLMVASGLTAGGIALVRSPLFELDGIEVSGARTLTHDEVLHASGLRLGMNVLSVDAGGIKSRLEQLPVVAEATVERVYPSKVRIRLRERLAAAAARLPNGVWLVEATGRLITAVAGTPAGLREIRVDGVQGSDGLRDGLSLWASLPAWARDKTTALEAREPAKLAATIGGTRVIFGSGDELIAKMQAVVAIFDRAREGGRRVVQIDVRTPRRPAAVLR